MAKLYLVGTHHLDLTGPERLEKFLGFVRPDAIGLESTVENFDRIGITKSSVNIHPSYLDAFQNIT